MHTTKCIDMFSVLGLWRFLIQTLASDVASEGGNVKQIHLYVTTSVRGHRS